MPEHDPIDYISVKNYMLDTTFTIKKVKAAFKSMGSMKSAGPDGLNQLL